MERYINHRRGERRIQVEIDEAEIPALIADLAASPGQSVQTRELLGVLEQAHRAFSGTGGDGA